MALFKELKLAKSVHGQPLYLAVSDAVRQAIDSGVFKPGEQIPSTQSLAKQLEVSLVTTHRAMQELVVGGVIQRCQGKGTFVHEKYGGQRRTASGASIAVLLPADASLADFHHNRIVEGMRQAAAEIGVDLLLPGWGEDVRNECGGLLFICPTPQQVDAHLSRSKRRATLIVGVESHRKNVGSISIDEAELAQQAVNHLAEKGHRVIGFVGSDDPMGRLRWQGFLTACQRWRLVPRDEHVVTSLGCKLDERERLALIRMLSGTRRPTAIFAAGWGYALNVYGAAAAAGLEVPKDLSFLGVDDPRSAEYLSPPLTTLRRPLLEVGREAVRAIVRQIQDESPDIVKQTMRAELIVRFSTREI